MAMNEDEDIANPKRSEKNLNNGMANIFIQTALN